MVLKKIPLILAIVIQGTWLGLGCLLFNTNSSYTWEHANVYCEQQNASVTVDGDDVVVISGLLTPDLCVWWTPLGGGDICVMLLSDTQEVDMIPLVV